MKHSSFFVLFFVITFCVIIFSCFTIPFYNYYPEIFATSNNDSPYTENIELSDAYLWPIPGYTRISSYFGKRTSPTVGASSFHKGLDIPAPAGTNLIAIADGTITYVGFNGSGGYTISYTTGNYIVSYCHVSPNYIVSLNENINKGEVIGYVGPKNVYDVPNNKYKDKYGNPTNGATTGSHLHFAIKKEGEYIDPFTLF